MKIAFLGLGLMGSAMARNLLKAGHTVQAWNRSATAAEALRDYGATVAATPLDAIGGCDAIFSMLADDTAVRGVFIESGLLGKIPRGCVHANFATISVALAQELTELHARHGLVYLATPVMGNSLAAVSGKLNILAAGDAEAAMRLQPALLAMGQAVWPQGSEPYRANAIKIATNFLLGAAVEALSEAVALTQAQHVDPAQFLHFITSTVFAAPAYKIYGEKIVNRQFEPAAFRLALGAKDMQLACDAAHAQGLRLPLGELVKARIGEAMAQGHADKDLAALALAPLQML